MGFAPGNQKIKVWAGPSSCASGSCRWPRPFSFPRRTADQSSGRRAGDTARWATRPVAGRASRHVSWRHRTGPPGLGAKAARVASGCRGGRPATGRRTGGVPGTTPASGGAVRVWRFCFPQAKPVGWTRPRASGLILFVWTGPRQRSRDFIQAFRGSVDVDGVNVPKTLRYPPAARIIARMPTRIASGNVGQALMSAARAGSMAGVSGVSAPDSAPTGGGVGEFSVECAGGSIPIHSRSLLPVSPHAMVELKATRAGPRPGACGEAIMRKRSVWRLILAATFGVCLAAAGAARAECARGG